MAPQGESRGFFYSKDDQRVKEPSYEELSKAEQKKVFEFLEEVYSVSKSEIKDLLFLKKGADVWVARKTAKSILKFQDKELTISSIGFRAIRNAFEDKTKITSNLATFLNEKIKSNIYNLNKQELENYLHGEDILIKNKAEKLKTYPCLKYNNRIYCVGLNTGTAIKNQLPKGRVLRNQITQFVEEE